MMRFRLRHDDNGAFAILYAFLVLLLVGMTGLLVDVGTMRSERSTDRGIADAAALAGASNLLPGPNPFGACVAALQYARASFSSGTLATDPAAACGGFTGAVCPPAPNPPIVATDTIAGRTVKVTWPVPDSTLQHPDVEELGSSAVQQPAQAVDGSTCNRIQVDIRANYQDAFPQIIGTSVFGKNIITVGSRSIALAKLRGGPKQQVAALNVLNTSVCSSLSVSGQGGVLVQRSLPSGTPPVSQPGIIAVESDGTGSGCSKNYVIGMNPDGNNFICAAGANSLGPCDGRGLILAHALDGAGSGRAYDPGDPTTAFKCPGKQVCAINPADQLMPTPTPEVQTTGWAPVTQLYGCESQLSSQCSPETGNWIQQLVSAYGDSGVPTSVYTGDTSRYSGPSYSGWTTISTCKPGSDTYYPAGNYYVNCTGSTAFDVKNVNVIFGGGTVVFGGDVTLDSGGCLAFNVPQLVSTCPTASTWVGVGTDQVTTARSPIAPENVYIRGALNGSANNNTFVAPETFIYQKATGGQLALGGGGGDILWTSPGAGPASNGPDLARKLSYLCGDTSVGGSADTACLESHFQKLTDWSAYNGAGTGGSNPADLLGGQGANQFVGVFFTPLAEVDLSGQGSSVGSTAQFWADTLVLTGQGAVNLIPNAELEVKRPIGTGTLIR